VVAFWVTIPLMVVAVLWGAGFVTFHSHREHRRLWTEKMIKGEVPRPEDGSVLVAATVRPGAELQANAAIADATGNAGDGEVWSAVGTEQTPEGRHVLLNIPADTVQQHGNVAADHVVDHLNNEDAFEDVERL
jgi:hypothetical protein